MTTHSILAIAANKDDLKETHDTNVGEYLSEMRLNEEDEFPNFDLTRSMDEDEEEDEQVAR